MSINLISFIYNKANNTFIYALIIKPIFVDKRLLEFVFLSSATIYIYIDMNLYQILAILLLIFVASARVTNTTNFWK